MAPHLPPTHFYVNGPSPTDPPPSTVFTAPHLPLLMALHLSAPLPGGIRLPSHCLKAGREQRVGYCSHAGTQGLSLFEGLHTHQPTHRPTPGPGGHEPREGGHV